MRAVSSWDGGCAAAHVSPVSQRVSPVSQVPLWSVASHEGNSIRWLKLVGLVARQDVLDNGVKLANDTVVQVWKWWEETSQAASATSGTAYRPNASPRCSLSRGCSQPLTEAAAPGWPAELDRVTKQVNIAIPLSMRPIGKDARWELNPRPHG